MSEFYDWDIFKEYSSVIICFSCLFFVHKWETIPAWVSHTVWFSENAMIFLFLLLLLTSSRSPQKQFTHKPSKPLWAGQLLWVFILRFWQHWYFSYVLRFNLGSLEHLKRRVDYLELSNTFQKQNNVTLQILPEPDDELLSAKLWLLNRSKQINKE